jgi:Domain of unknown function (DUF1937)
LPVMSTDPLSYLATPYSRYPGGIEAAFMDAACLAARLLRIGVKVYSPICHTHPIAMCGNIDPLDHAIWMPFDEAMMRVCDMLIVAHMPSWETSKGIAMEVEHFEKAGKRIFDLDPVTLVMTRRE